MELAELRAQVGASGARAPGRRFPAELRAQLVWTAQRLWSAGQTVADIADALGVHPRTVARYLHEPVVESAVEEDPVDGVVVGGDEPALVPVVFPTTPMSSFGASLRVTTPEGFVVDGLDVAGVVALLRALGR